MSKKLFAMEEMDNEISDVELEVGPEEGEVADVQAEVETEIADIAGDADGIENAEEAGDQLEEVGDLVADASEEGEGLDPVAAEAVRISIEAICARVGADPKKMGMYHLYATENFKSSSSRKANTQIALEGIKDFLKELWEKIKNAVKSLWKKVTEFWDKHISSLGRVLKALESMKKKVKATKGTLKGTGRLDKAPSNLVSAFVPSNELTHKRVAEFIDTHTTSGSDFVAMVNSTGTIKIEASGKISGLKVKDKNEFGSEAKPFVGGVYYVQKFEEEDDKVSTTLETEQVEITDGDVGLTIASKSDLDGILTSTITLVKATIAAKAAIVESGKKFDEVMSTFNQHISKSDTLTPEKQKQYRKSLNSISSINTGTLSLSVKFVSLDVRLAKAVLGFTNTCLKQFKD